jgi:hypothetical protein
VDALSAIILGAIGSIIAAEIVALAPILARWIIAIAVRSMEAAQQERYREEWLADLEERPGNFAKIWHALGCLSATMHLLPASRPSNPRTLVDRLRDLLTRLLESQEEYAREAFKSADISLGELKARLQILEERFHDLDNEK